MTIQHDLTEADLRNYLAMRKPKTKVRKDQVMPAVITAYFWVGLTLMNYFLDLSLWQFLWMVTFCLGFALLFVLMIKRGAAKQVGRSLQGITGPRTYILAESVLETHTADSRHLTPLEKIIGLESNARGTMLRFAVSSPLFLPFGTEYRSDFIAALRAAMPQGTVEPPKLAP